MIDGDNDGVVDSITFVVSGSPGGWSELLWPHKWSLYTYTVTINGKTVGEYAFQLDLVLNTGVLAHEMFHVLGSPDLYHYTDNGIAPVGYWDLMEWNTNPPQHMGCYMKFKYGNWISSVPTLTAPGTYTLNPLTSSTNNCFKIPSPYSTTEFFVVEYRRETGTFENSLPGTGSAGLPHQHHADRQRQRAAGRGLHLPAQWHARGQWHGQQRQLQQQCGAHGDQFDLQPHVVPRRRQPGRPEPMPHRRLGGHHLLRLRQLQPGAFQPDLL